MNMEDILFMILGAFATMALAFFVGATYGGLVRKIIARTQNRVGPPWYQNFIDILKLYSKKTAIHHGAMQHIGPAFAITASVTVLMFVPVLRDGGWFPWFKNLNFQGDIIFLIYMMVFGSLGMALGIGQTGNPNASIGVSRGLSMMVGYEIPFVLSLVAVMVQTHTTSITGLMEWQTQHGWLMFEAPFAFATMILTTLGMFHYGPFDVSHAPSEIASGPPSEFGGKYLAMMMTSGSIFAFAKLVFIVDVFMNGADNLVILVVKTLLLYMIPVLYGAVSPRYRTEQAIRYFWGWPVFIGIIALVFSIYY